MHTYLYDPDEDTVEPVARRALGQWRDSDAGITYNPFVVEARDSAAALEGARRWRDLWADEDTDEVPDDLALVEHEVRGGTFMILYVS